MIRHALLGSALIVGLAIAHAGDALAPVKVEIVGQPGAWSLMRGGKPYFVNGGGGGGDKQLLKDIGGNSSRTWGAGADTLEKLDEAQRLGQTVTVGHWLGHPLHDFDYHDPKSLDEQKAAFRKTVETFKDHPAVLMWSIGNEMEIAIGDKEEALWKHVNELAKLAKAIDPNHPTMTIVADIWKEKVQNIHNWCPDVDVIGINTYGGALSAAQRYQEYGGTKPYMLTEYGPDGVANSQKSDWGGPMEPSSAEKAEKIYRPIYQTAIENEKGKRCLGGYAFTWGNKVEGTPTWYGILLPTRDGDARLATCDVLQEFWTGKKPAVPCPVVKSLTIDQPGTQLDPGTTFTATMDYESFDGQAPRIEFELFEDSKEYTPYQGHGTPMPPTLPEAIVNVDGGRCTIKLPDAAGKRYFLYGRVFDHHNGAGYASLSILAEPKETIRAPRPPAFPLVVVGDNMPVTPFYASGYMGNHAAIKMDEKSRDEPKFGDTCLRADYTAPDNWAGVYWQNPANDWNEKDGGWNLTGATALTFWARGARGGEKVKFMFGLTDRKNAYYDTTSAGLDVTMTKEWKQYSIDLAGRDLRRIKTGFGWVVGGQGAPMTFYLDDVQFEGVPPPPDANAEAEPAVEAAGGKGALPFAVLPEEAGGKPTFYASGYMGNNGAVKMADSNEQPATGRQCLKIDYTAPDNWAGVYWQNPANDWNEKPGGFDLTGAQRLSWKARGEKGGEKVKFLFGVTDRKNAFFDTAGGEREVTLTREWQDFSISLEGKDLSRIKSGFGWVVGGQGAPIAFYLDDVRYE